MDEEAHTIMAAIHKAEHDKQAEKELHEDMRSHEEHSKHAQKQREELLAERQETWIHDDEYHRGWNANLREIEEHAKEVAVNRDTHKHEDRMERATHHQQEFAAKRQADTEKLEHNSEEHRKKAALRHAAARSSE